MEDWKKDRLSIEIHENEKKIMAEALEKKRKAEDEKWFELRQSLYVGESEADKNIDWVVDRLKDKYELPIKKNH